MIIIDEFLSGSAFELRGHNVKVLLRGLTSGLPTGVSRGPLVMVAIIQLSSNFIMVGVPSLTFAVSSLLTFPSP